VTTAISSDPQVNFQSSATGGRAVLSDTAKHIWRVYCLDKTTGKILWEQTAHEGAPKIKRHLKASHANSTPVTDGKHLVAFFGSEGLYCYDLSGKLLWKQDLGVLNAGYVGFPELQWGTASSPIIYKNMVILQCDSQQNSFVAAYDLDSGKRVWVSERDDLPSWSTPLIFEGKRLELITVSPKFIRGLDPTTGKELWRIADYAEVRVPAPIAAHGLIFISGGAPRGRHFFAVRPGGSGNISLDEGGNSHSLIAWQVSKGGPYTPTPIVYGDYLYVCADNGVLSCYRAQTGELVYQKRISETGGSYSASPIAADGKLYLASEDGEVQVIKAGAEFERIASNPMGESLMATPAISGGLIFIRGQHHLFAVSN
jgi:outer membrane protein assembly factor BamB